MDVRVVLGGFYVDALPSGYYEALIPGLKFVTSSGDLPLPSATSYPLFHRISEDGKQTAGQASASPGTWVFDGRWTLDPRICNGTSAAIFDATGALHVIEPGPGVTSQGYRYVAPDGSLVRGDATYGPFHRLSEYTDLSMAQDGSLLVGQGHDAGGVCIWDGTTLRRLADGSSHAIRARRVGERFSIAWYSVAPDGLSSHIAFGAISELLSLPAIPAPGPIDPPKETRLSVPNISDFVISFLKPRLRLVGDIEQTRANTYAAVNACVLEARKTDPRWGVLEKKGGANVRERAADIMLYRINDKEAQVVDVVGNGEGEADDKGVRHPPVAAFSISNPNEGGAIRSVEQWKEPYPAVDVVDPPDDGGGDDDDEDDADILKVLAAISDRLDQIRDGQAGIRARLTQIEQNDGDVAQSIIETKKSLLDIQMGVSFVAARPITFPAYTGRVLGQTFTLNPRKDQ